MATQAVPIDSAFRRALAGDEAGFADLIRSHESMVFSICLHFLRNRAAAEELAQEVFLHLYRNLGSLESPEHVTHWLRKVTSHRCIDLVRRNGLAGWTTLDKIPEPAAFRAPSDPLLADHLAKLVAALPERWRMIVILRYQEDLDPAEIAELLDVPVGTVKSALHRALALLRAKMEVSGKGPAS